MKKLNKTLYSVLCLMICMCTLSGCIEEFEADIPSEDSNLLVVEGTIISSRENTFILTRTLPINSFGTPKMETKAILSVRGTDGSEYKAQSDYGKYTCMVGDLNPDEEYYLHIEVDGEIYESVPQKPMRTEKIAEVSGVQNTPESNIDILITPEAPIDSTKENYYSWTYDETWEVHPDYITDLFFDVENMRIIKKENQFPVCGWIDATSSTIMVGAGSNYQGQHIQRLKLYDIDRSNERMYYRYSGLIHQRAISKAEYEYELARRQASSEMGGLFTPQPSSLPTNIQCRTSKKNVIGFVGCSLNTGEYRFFLNYTDYSIYRQKIGSLAWIEDCSMEDCLRMVERGMYLCKYEDSMKSVTGKSRSAWAYGRQVDVRYRGAYTEMPSFWLLTKNVSY